MSDGENTFQRDWGFPSEVLTTVAGARWHETRPLPENYSTGRPRWETLFLSEDKQRVVERRNAMELVSKRTGRKYFVCARQSAAERKAAFIGQAVDEILAKPGREPLGIDDVFA